MNTKTLLDLQKLTSPLSDAEFEQALTQLRSVRREARDIVAKERKLSTGLSAREFETQLLRL